MNINDQDVQGIEERIRKLYRKLFRISLDEADRGHNANMSVEDFVQNAWVAIIEAGIEPGLWLEQEEMTEGTLCLWRDYRGNRREKEVNGQMTEQVGGSESTFNSIPASEFELEDALRQVRVAAKERIRRQKVRRGLENMRKRNSVLRMAAEIVEAKEMALNPVPLSQVSQSLNIPAEKAGKLLEYGKKCVRAFATEKGEYPKWKGDQEVKGQREFTYSTPEQQGDLFANEQPSTMDTVSCVA